MGNKKSVVILMLSFFVGGLHLAKAEVLLKPNVGIGASVFSRNFSGMKNQLVLGTSYGIDVLAGRRVYVQTGLRYIRDSYKMKGSGFMNFESTVHNFGLKIPLHVGVHLFKMGNLIRSRVFVGPSIKTTTQVESKGVKLLERRDYSDVICGYEFGFGLDIWKFFVEGGYELGLNEMVRKHKIRSNGIYLTAGVSIKIK